MNQIFRRAFCKTYTKTHEWVKLLGNGKAQVGISDHAQELITTIVFVELRSLNSIFEKDQSIATIESVKSTVDVYAPFKMEIQSYNPKVIDNWEEINNDAENQYIYEVKILDEGFKGMNAEEYKNFYENEELDD